MSTCQLCGQSGLVWHENLGKLVNEITGTKHGYNICIIKIPRFELFGNIVCYRRQESIAADIIRRCIEAGKDLDKVRPVIEGDFLIIK